MNTVIVNRAQSAYSRPSYQSETNSQDRHLKHRPETSKSTHRRDTDLFDQDDFKTRKSSTASHRRQSRIASSNATTRPASRHLRSNEIENLLQSLDRDDTVIVELDCLADYRTLVQTIDLRKTPIDNRILCALQQRENRIVQENACRDTRFRSLIELLQPAYILERIERDHSNDTNRSPVFEYPHNNVSYEYVK